MSDVYRTTVGEDGLIELDDVEAGEQACVIDEQSLAVITYKEVNENGNIEMEAHQEDMDVRVVIA